MNPAVRCIRQHLTIKKLVLNPEYFSIFSGFGSQVVACKPIMAEEEERIKH